MQNEALRRSLPTNTADEQICIFFRTFVRRAVFVGRFVGSFFFCSSGASSEASSGGFVGGFVGAFVGGFVGGFAGFIVGPIIFVYLATVPKKNCCDQFSLQICQKSRVAVRRKLRSKIRRAKRRCVCRLSLASHTFVLPNGVEQEVSVPLSFHRKRSLKLVASQQVPVPLSFHRKRSLKLAVSTNH